MGNGLQGCSTTKVGPNGVGVSPANAATVYTWNATPGSQYPPGFQNSQSAPFIVNLPDDTTLSPGVSYYYLAQVVWMWSVEQDSNTITVPNAYASLPHALVSGLTPVKQNGNAPPPPSQSKSGSIATVTPLLRTAVPATSSPAIAAASMTAQSPAQQVTSARPMMAPMMNSAPTTPQAGSTMSSAAPSSAPLLAQAGTAASSSSAPLLTQHVITASPTGAAAVPANLSVRIKQVQQNPHDAQALYALGKAYCASSLTNTGVSYMYMPLLLAEHAGNAPLTAQIKNSLAAHVVNAK